MPSLSAELSFFNLSYSFLSMILTPKDGFRAKYILSEFHKVCTSMPRYPAISRFVIFHSQFLAKYKQKQFKS